MREGWGDGNGAVVSPPLPPLLVLFRAVHLLFAICVVTNTCSREYFTALWPIFCALFGGD